MRRDRKSFGGQNFTIWETSQITSARLSSVLRCNISGLGRNLPDKQDRRSLITGGACITHKLPSLELFGMLSEPSVKNIMVLLWLDNTTAVAYINHMGGVQSQMLAQKVIQTWKWALHREIFLKVRHIAGLENQAAHKMSEQTGSLFSAKPIKGTSLHQGCQNHFLDSTLGIWNP